MAMAIGSGFLLEVDEDDEDRSIISIHDSAGDQSPQIPSPVHANTFSGIRTSTDAESQPLPESPSPSPTTQGLLVLDKMDHIDHRRTQNIF
jgi:hypothetical protein